MDQAETETRPLRVLVVDDHRMNREVACVLLSAAGCEIAMACDGIEAVEAVRDGGFDVVLMDLRMPGMDGLEAARAIRDLPDSRARIPIIAVTADAMAADASRCLEAGMNAHMPKPISQASLLAMLFQVLKAEAESAQAVRADRAIAS